MDLDISPGDIDRTHRIVVLSKGKNRPLIVKCVRYMDRRHIFTNKKRLKGKNMSITESLTEIRISALKEARNKFGFSSIWTADRKIMYEEEGDTKTKVYFDSESDKQELCYGKNRKDLFLILMASFYFYLFGGFFTKHSKTVSYFVCLILLRSILPLITIILIKTQFVHFISQYYNSLMFTICKFRFQQNINFDFPIVSFNNKLC